MVAVGLRLGMVAGEASGDLLGGLLLAGLKRRWPQVQAAGIGGPKLVAQGFDAWWPHERLSVFGYVDALKRLPELLRLRAQLAERLIAAHPAAFIGIDAPDFNFGLETRACGGPEDGALRLSVHLGLAWRAGAEAQGRGRPGAVPVPVRA